MDTYRATNTLNGKFYIGSICEASRELGFSDSNLSGRYLKPGKVPKRGKFKGWQFFYENP